MAKRSRICSLMYSNWIYPLRLLREVSIFPFPHRWTTWKLFRSSGRIFLTASLTCTAPVLPPTTIIIGLSVVNPHSSRPASLLPRRSSCLIGEPVSTALSFGRYLTVSGKLQHIRVAFFIAILLARPGVISDSWIITGICLFPAASTTGTDTKPPFENTISGLMRRISFPAWK